MSGIALLLTIESLLCTAQTVPQVSSPSLTFTAIADGPSPPTQVVTVLSPDGSPFNFSVLADSGTPGSDTPSWLAVPHAQATTPAQIRVSVDQSGLTPGTYPARIQLTDTQGRALGVIVNVTLNVAPGAPQLSVSPARLNFASTLAAGTMQSGVLVRNLGSGALAPVSASVVSGASWLSASVDSCDKSCVVRIRAFAGAVTPGALLGVVRINNALGSQDIPVSLLVADHSPLLQASSDELQFESLQGSGFADSRVLSVANTGDLFANWSADIVDGKQWLSVSPSSGATAAGASATVTVSMNPGILAAGTYGGLIRFSYLGAGSLNVLYIPVSLKVDPAGTPAVPLLSTGGVVLAPAVGGVPGVFQLTLSAASASAVPFQVAAQGPSWLSVTPPRGLVSGAQPAQLTIGADPNNLGPGFYSGLINVAFGNTSLRTLNVAFNPPLNGDACTVQNLHLIETGTPDGFAARTGFPVPLDATVIDDCGNPISTALVLATFSNNDPGLVLRGVGNGRYVQTWTPSNPSSGLPGGNVSVALRAFAPGLVATTYELIGSVSSDNAPSISSGGVVNNFYPQTGAAAAPGAVVQIFGNGFGKGTAPGIMLAGRLSTSLQGVSVKIGGIDAPLYYTSAGQINAQVPAELPVNRQHQVIVNVNGVYSKPEPINLSFAQPGIATYPDTRAIAQDVNYNLIDPQHPAHSGDVVILYLAGMGATNPPVITGAPAPRSPLAQVVLQPQVTIDGIPAPVIFAGLSPDFVGLYQIDLTVPDGVKAGNLPIVVTQNGVASNIVLLPVR